jgi:hypothetical protein
MSIDGMLYQDTEVCQIALLAWRKIVNFPFMGKSFLHQQRYHHHKVQPPDLL